MWDEKVGLRVGLFILRRQNIYSCADVDQAYIESMNSANESKPAEKSNRPADADIACHHPVWGPGTIILRKGDDIYVSYPTRGRGVWQDMGAVSIDEVDDE